MATLALTVSVAAAAPALPNFVPLAKSAGLAVGLPRHASGYGTFF